MLEYADQEKDARIGFSALGPGMDPNSINKTATFVREMTNITNAKAELIARNAAEFGFKPLFKGIMYLLAKHQQQALMVRLSNTFVPVDPETWSKEYDMSCNVGLGLGSKDQQLMQLQTFGAFLQTVGASPFGTQLLDAKKVFNFGQKLCELSGFKDVSTFMNDPEGTQPPPPPKPELVQVEEIKSQTTMQAKQLEQQGKGQELMAKGQMEMQKMQQEAGLREQELRMQAELERYKADLDAQTKKEIELFRAQLSHQQEMARNESMQKPTTVVQVDGKEELRGMADHMSGHGQHMAQAVSMMAQGLQGLHQALTRPKQIIRDKTGRAIGVQ